MLEQLSSAERRSVLLSSRIHYGPEFDVPRKRALEAMIENVLFVVKEDEWVTADDALALLSEVGNMPSIHLPEVSDVMRELAARERIECDGLNPFGYRLKVSTRMEVQNSYEEASSRLSKIIAKLFADCSQGIQSKILPFFLDLTCEVFSLLGFQWAKYITGKPLGSFIDGDTLERIVDRKLTKHSIPSARRNDIKRRALLFFQQSDPEFNQYKFALGQSLYVVQLLALDGSDLMSKETFREGTLYLDSSVLIPALLSESRHHRVFEELRKVCDRLQIVMATTRVTVDEVRNVAAEQKKLAPQVFDVVSTALAPSVKGDFFHTYLSMKAVSPETALSQVFAPFDQLADTLREMGIEVVDDPAFETIGDEPSSEGVKSVLAASSLAIRKRPKFANAIRHDAIVFAYLRTLMVDSDKLWFVSRDVSLPHAWSTLEPEGVKVRCFLLDGLLQAISPFLIADDQMDSYSEMFSQAVAGQLLPQRRIFDIEDFMLFHDLDLDCREMDDSTVQEALFRVKQYVLKGASYRKKNLEDAAYELRKYFANRRDSAAKWTEERASLEKSIANLEGALSQQTRAHNLELESLQQQHNADFSALKSQHESEIKALEGRLFTIEAQEDLKSKRRRGWLNFGKQSLALLLAVPFLWLAFKAALTYAAGDGWAARLSSGGSFFAVAIVLWLLLVKVSLFRKTRLKEAFPVWSEIKELF